MNHDALSLRSEARCYSTGVDHYLSPTRHDGVKTHWEQPFTRAVIRHAIERLHHAGPLRILDVGSGTGDGLVLATQAMDEMPGSGAGRLRYVGLDMSADMVRTARRLHGDRRHVRFIRGDMRTAIPRDPVDLYLSCGVPYSHLTRRGLRKTLDSIFAAVRRNGTRSAVIVDVLGRYSIEWPTKWRSQRWGYRMSFFSTHDRMPPTPMSFYGADELGDMVRRAAADAGCALTGIDFFDRSIMVGRHTMTGEYNRALPRYRRLVNGLMDPERETDLATLLFDRSLTGAPAEVLRFFARFTTQWNGLIAAAAAFCGERLEYPESWLLPAVPGLGDELARRRAAGNGAGFRARVVEPTLAEYLRRLEATCQPGLGVSHSLSALAVVDGAGNAPR